MRNALGKVVRKTMPKKEVLKLQPGTLVRVAWLDSPDSVHLILEKPVRDTGDLSLTTWTTDQDGRRLTGVSSDQIVEVVGSLEIEIEDQWNRIHVHTKHGTQVIHL